MVHDQLIRERVPNMRLLYPLVHHGMYDADAAVHAEGQSHLLVHTVEVRVSYLVNQLQYTYDPCLFTDWEA